MSELSRRSGVPVPTVKYYLREGILPPGRPVGATRADYDDGHVQRLRLIRALVDVAGMGLDRVREVLAAVDDDSVGLVDAIGTAHVQLSPEPRRPPSPEATERVVALVLERGLHVEATGRHGRAVAAGLDALDHAGQPVSEATLATYADAMRDVAAEEVRRMYQPTRAGATAYAVIGTLLAEPVLLALRRLLHEHFSREGEPAGRQGPASRRKDSRMGPAVDEPD